MTALSEWRRFKAPGAHRPQLLAFGLYTVAALTLLGVGTMSLAAAVDDYAWLGDNQERLLSAAARPTASSSSAGVASARSALLWAKTIGVAAAELQQRVEASSHDVGAKTLSSRVDLQDASAANGVLTYVGEIELDAASLQPLLYNLEAGTPFLEIADLSIQPLQDAAAGGRLRLSLSVTACWRPDP
jgi:general secretion pathway protein M